MGFTDSIFSLFSRLLVRVRKGIDNRKSKIIAKRLKKVGYNFKITFPISTYGLENITIGNNFKTGERLKLRTFSHWEDKHYNPSIVIGNNVSLESDCHISAISSIIIEDNVLIASHVYISDHSHGQINLQETTIPPILRPLFSRGGVIIEKNVWIGEKVTILPNVIIGEGSIIGANSVVTKDIPPFSVAVGSPAKVVKQLNL